MHGHVLGLQIQGMRLVALTSRIRSGVPADLLSLCSATSLQGELRRGGIQVDLSVAKATRVDVCEVSMTLVSRLERSNKPASFQVFASVDGRILVVQVWEGMLVSELRAVISPRLHASLGECCVMRGGKLLSLLSSVEAAGVVKGSWFELHARGIGGSAPILGERFCNHCNRSGCWPPRQRCFRCGVARSDRGPGKGGKAKGKGGPPHETSYLGRGLPPTGRTRSPKPLLEGTMPDHVSPEVVSQHGRNSPESLSNLGSWTYSETRGVGRKMVEGRQPLGNPS